MIKQLGCPSLFLTLSADDKNWPVLLKKCWKAEYGKDLSDEECEKLSGAERNKLLRNHPNIAAQSTLPLCHATMRL